MQDGPTRTSPMGSLSRPGSGGGRFVSGTVLAGRYRIVSLIGKGGMGEVYKAEDLKLDQPVALKFLPETLGLNAAALARFHAEVRIARQVSHPNVCRVYDIGEIDGLHYLTMELIDGEDLSSLLRRIGRLPADKAIEIARQLCAGVAAAHEAGVLHRDLKPANVMIDGRGRARVTDFGVAAIAREIKSEHVLAGTPAYMAPEQLKGQDATIRSDVYALGLVLYELFTGKRAVDVNTLSEALLHQTSGAMITSPSNVIAELDLVVERAILRCLEKDPAERPASAIHVARALPGGDPLHAALIAGETPSPEMVAASGSKELLRPAVGLAILAATIVVLLAGAWGHARTSVLGRVPLDLPPDVLAHQAREMLRGFGYVEAPADAAYGFDNDVPFLTFVRYGSSAGSRWSRLDRGRPSVVQFWYRESRSPLQITSLPDVSPASPVRIDDPPLADPGMILLRLDSAGRLVGLRVIGGAGGTTAAPSSTDWTTLFKAADLDSSAFRLAEPSWLHDVAYDARMAWVGAYPEQPDLELRIEAAANRSRLVSVELFGTWRPVTATPAQPLNSSRPTVLPFVLVVIATVLAWRNVRAGRGDRRGAKRVAIVSFGFQAVFWVLVTDHIAGRGELELLYLAMGHWFVNCATVYVEYLAIEPYIRRYWPQVLIAWTRAWDGRLRDHAVGKEVLAGVALGALWFLGSDAIFASTSAFSATSDLDVMLNLRRVVGLLDSAIGGSIALSLLASVFALVVRTVLRREWLVAIVWVAIGIASGGLGAGGWFLPGAITIGLIALFVAIALMRFGLVAVVALFVTWRLLTITPTTLDMSAWYAGPAIFTLAVVASMAAYGCYLAVGAPALFGGPKRSALRTS